MCVCVCTCVENNRLFFEVQEYYQKQGDANSKFVKFTFSFSLCLFVRMCELYEGSVLLYHVLLFVFIDVCLFFIKNSKRNNEEKRYTRLFMIALCRYPVSTSFNSSIIASIFSPKSCHIFPRPPCASKGVRSRSSCSI